MDWMIVKHSYKHNPIGALGYIDNKIAVVSTFYDDKDLDNDGEISLAERFFSLFSMRGRALAEVLSQAKADPDIFMRDPSLQQLQGEAIVNFASGMIMEGIYISYFKMGVSQASSAVAGSLVSGTATRFVVRKGMEATVKRAYDFATN